MILREMSKAEAKKTFASWNTDQKPNIEKPLDSEYALLRENIVEAIEAARRESMTLKEKGEKLLDYDEDLRFALKLYNILGLNNNFTLRNATFNNFWIYLSVCVVPDVVWERWGNNEDRFYGKTRRIWLKILWWYIHLSWQGTREKTYEVLKYNTADDISQLVERVGRNGYRVELFREVIRYLGQIQARGRKPEVLRKVMKLNTARSSVLEPALVSGGIKGYVKGLYSYFGY